MIAGNANQSNQIQATNQAIAQATNNIFQANSGFFAIHSDNFSIKGVTASKILFNAGANACQIHSLTFSKFL
jgi:hypothetical protein